MKRDAIAKPLESSFLSCERDTETILKKLFIDSRQHSKTLKRLLVVTNEDCLTNATGAYAEAENMSLKQLIDQGYIILSPVVKQEEYAKLKAAVVISFNNFLPNQTNPEFRDCTVNVDVLCHMDCWDLTNYQQRPFKILGYVDGILNKTKLSGIGELEFAGCSGPVINADIGMFSMMYRAVHGSEDTLPDDQYNGGEE